jgi:succinate dehydrogenase / fumarate reductase iron-sulfur subunit
MKVKLKVWRQKDATSPGAFEIYESPELNPNMSFLEMLDVVNEELTQAGKDPVAFDHDCREGICGTCSLMIDGKAHGPHQGVASCQTYMRSFSDGDEILVEPFRAKPFPVIRDLVVNRKAFDKIVQSGGFISVRTGAAPDANSIPIGKGTADMAMDAASCIGCGACVAQCKNASAMLFVAAKAAQLNILPQGKPEKDRRVLGMVSAMDDAGFGSCTNQYECSAVCPKLISHDFIARLNRDYLGATLRATFSQAPASTAGGAG